MDSFRKHPPVELAGVKVIAVEDYLTSVKKELTTGKLDPIKLPKSNVLKYFLDGSWVFLCTSIGDGTKVQVLFCCQGSFTRRKRNIAEKSRRCGNVPHPGIGEIDSGGYPVYSAGFFLFHS